MALYQVCFYIYNNITCVASFLFCLSHFIAPYLFLSCMMLVIVSVILAEEAIYCAELCYYG